MVEWYSSGYDKCRIERDTKVNDLTCRNVVIVYAVRKLEGLELSINTGIPGGTWVLLSSKCSSGINDVESLKGRVCTGYLDFYSGSLKGLIFA